MGVKNRRSHHGLNKRSKLMKEEYAKNSIHDTILNPNINTTSAKRYALSFKQMKLRQYKHFSLLDKIADKGSVKYAEIRISNYENHFKMITTYHRVPRTVEVMNSLIHGAPGHKINRFLVE